MNKPKNVECQRCGKKWYSEKFEEEEKLPDYCTRCYRSEVREIPEPPTKIDILIEKLKKKKKEVPKKAGEKKHQLILWKEQNRFLISMIKTGIGMIIIITLLIYALFFL